MKKFLIKQQKICKIRKNDSNFEIFKRKFFSDFYWTLARLIFEDSSRHFFSDELENSPGVTEGEFFFNVVKIAAKSSL